MSPTGVSREEGYEQGVARERGRDGVDGGSLLTLSFGQVVHDRHHDAPRYRVRQR